MKNITLAQIQKDFFLARAKYRKTSLILLKSHMQEICSLLEKGQYIDFQAYSDSNVLAVINCGIAWQGRRFSLFVWNLKQEKEISRKIKTKIQKVEKKIVDFISAQVKNDLDFSLINDFLSVVHGVWGAQGRLKSEKVQQILIKEKVLRG